MKVKDSEYLKRVRPLLGRLLEELTDRFPYASILAQDGTERSYSVSRRLRSINGGGRFSDRGFVVKVFNEGRWSEHSFNELTEEDLPRVVEAVVRGAAVRGPEGTGYREYEIPEAEPLKFKASTDFEIDPAELGDESILARLQAIRDRGFKAAEGLIDCRVNATWNRTSKLFLAPGRELEQNVMWMTGSVMAAAPRGQEIMASFVSYSNLGGAEVLGGMDGDVERVAKVALELTASEPLTPGEYECVCTPDVTGMIVHEAFGHGVEMDMFVKNRALAQKYVGEYVASPLVTMHDGAAKVPETGSYFFDDEGTLAHDTVIIEKGVLKRGISDYQSAKSLGTEPTGNGRRESFRRKAYTRMTNTWFEAGTDTLEDMIASVKDGLLLEEPSSGMEDPKNWGIQCMVNYAREIKDGKFTGRIFSPVVLTGYVPDLLKSITMMSDSAMLHGSGMCGKGYKEWVKVSDGGPYIKARIRLG